MRAHLTVAVLFVMLSALSVGQARAQSPFQATVYPGRPLNHPADAFTPGLFYFQFWDASANGIFRYISTPKMYNCLRETKFYADCWRWSTSRDDLLKKMQDTGLRGWLQSLYEWTDRVVVKINGMPYWLSSSSSTEVLNDKSWREFMVHPPRDWGEWEDAIESSVALVASWGIHPYYEIWNEPDGEYWKGSDAEFLELYRRTALAIKRTDPKAIIGGPGMHTWWRSVDPALAAEQQPYMNALYGLKSDALPERYALLYALLDSVQNGWNGQDVPLDFISYHHFNHNRYEIIRTAEQVRGKMLSLGFCPRGTPCPSGRPFPELYISEWQTTYGAQEQVFQPSLFLVLLDAMGQAGIEMNSIAALADFDSDPDDEFTHGWGMISGNHLVKPVYKVLQLLDAVTGHGNLVEVTSEDLTGWASMRSDTLRVLLAEYSMPPIWYSQYPKVGWDAFEALLYHPESTLTKADFQAAGHTSLYWGHNDWGSIDRIIRGELAPFPSSNPEMMSALVRARHQWVKDSIALSEKHTLQLHIAGMQDTLHGLLYRIDSSRNNIIALYDSLRAAGYSHLQAIDSLQSCSFPGGCYGVGWEVEEVTAVAGDLDIEIDANSVCYFQFGGISSTTSVERFDREVEQFTVYPQPARQMLSYELPPTWKHAQITLHNLYGQVLRHGTGGRGSMSIESLHSGVYLLRAIRKNGKTYSRPVVVLH
ncbi:T9SS type A sorting domain-containing protein [bacterium]|nr:T9SS type A sorting domain-containing protein [bacterium]